MTEEWRLTTRRVAWAMLVFFAIEGAGDLDRWRDGLAWGGWPWAGCSILEGLIVVGALDLWHCKVMR